MTGWWGGPAPRSSPARGPDDGNVTTFYRVVTTLRRVLTPGRSDLAIKGMGEAMASAPGLEASGGTAPGAGATPVFFTAWPARTCTRLVALGALALALGCGQAPPPVEAAPPPAATDATTAADPATSAPPEGAQARYFSAVLDDLLGADPAAVRAAYAGLVDDPAAPAALAARAALRAASFEAASGRPRRALELIAHAGAVGGADPLIVEAADRIRGTLAAISTQDAEVRGPPVGTAPAAVVSPAAAAAFAAAEDQLRRALRVRLRPQLESLSSSLRAKERAVEAAARGYRMAAAASAAVTSAAEYRTGTLYHDLGLALVFELPPELDPGEAARLRRQLRERAASALRQAIAAYRRALAPTDGSSVAEVWRAAAQAELRAAEILVGAR